MASRPKLLLAVCSLGCFSGSILRLALESPTDLVALGGGPGLADGTINGALVGATTTHFFEDPLGVQFGLQTLEGAVYAFTTFDIYASAVFFHKI